jgi:hypothetical protein
MFTNASIITIIYFIVKFIETKYITKDKRAVKYLVRDTLVVMVSCISGLYVIQYMKDNELVTNTAVAFTGKPEF